MFSPNKCLIIVISALTMNASVVNAAKYSLRSSIDMQTSYDDNIFLSSSPNVDDVVKLTLTPRLSAIVQEQNWRQNVDLRAVANRYSEQSLDNEDTFLDYDAILADERSSFNFSAGYVRDSNLSTTSLDQGLADQLVKSTIWNIGPGYQYRWSEQLSFSLSANRSNKEYDEGSVTSFIGYQADAVRTAAIWAIDERSSTSLQVQFTDYESEDGSFLYELLSTTIGFDHQLSEIWSFSGSIGRSNRTSTNVDVSDIVLFGQTITVTDEIDVETTDKVLDLTLSGKFQTSGVSLSYLENDQTNSFGGLNRVRFTRFNYRWQPSERWTYVAGARHDITQGITQGTQNTDRTLDVVSLSASYRLALNWKLTARYSHRRLEFDNLVSASEPTSNTITFGLRYDFPEVSSD